METPTASLLTSLPPPQRAQLIALLVQLILRQLNQRTEAPPHDRQPIQTPT